MAFPVSIDATVTMHATDEYRPFLSSGGNVYCIQSTALSVGLTAYKATDPSSSFSSVGTGPVTTITGFSVIQDSDLLHITTFNTTTLIYYYHKFNMATDTWDTTNESIADVSGKSAPSDVISSIAYRAVSGDELVVAIRGLIDTVMGTNYERVDFYHKNKTATTWTGPVAIDDAGEVHYSLVGMRSLVLGASNRVHCVYSDTVAATQAKTIKTDNTLTTAADSALASHTRIGAVSFDNSGTQEVRFVTTDTTNNLYMLQENTGTGAIEWESTQSIDNIITPVSAWGVEYDTGTTLRAIGTDLSGDDVMLSSSTDGGSTWDTWTDIYTGGTSLSASFSPQVNIYTRNGDKVLAYIYYDNADPYYSEYVLVAGGGATRRVFLIS